MRPRTAAKFTLGGRCRIACSEVVRVLMGQIEIAWEDPVINGDRVEAALARLRPEPGTMVVLPEMFGTGFSIDARRACAGSDALIARLASWARRWNCWVISGLAVDEPDGPSNCALCHGPDGREIFRFRKLHGFSPVGEPTAYRAGEGVGVWDVAGFRLAPFICYDLRFPEVFRQASALGAELMVVIANWPARRERHWLALLQARAIENQSWVIGVNRAGTDPSATYSGRSILVDPMGVIRADAGEGERWITADMDVAEVKAWREAFPALRDRREWRIR